MRISINMKILTAVLILLSLCGISSADIIYTTTDGQLGVIAVYSSSDISAPSVEYKSGISYPLLSSYWNGTSTNVMLIENNKTASGDKAYVFNPEDLTKFSGSYDIAGVHGAENAGYAENGRSIFLTAGSKIFEVNTSQFKVINSYDCSRVVSDNVYGTEIQSIAVEYSTINVLTYAGPKYKFVRFDGQLKEGVPYFMSSDVAIGASCLCIVNNIALLGHGSGVDGLSRQNRFERIISTDYPVRAICPDDESSFYFATMHETESGYEFLVAHPSNTELTTKLAPVTLISDYPYIQLVKDKTLNVLAVMTAEMILTFDMRTGRQSGIFDTAALKGQPIGIAAASVTGYSSKNGSSGCNSFGSIGLILTALTAMMFKRK